MAESKRQNLHLPDGRSENRICQPEIDGERSSEPFSEWQKPRLDVSIVKSSYNKGPSDAGPLSKMRQAERERRGPGPREEPEPEPEGSEKPSLEWIALQFDKAKQERREKGCEDVEQDKREAFMLEYVKMEREKLAQGGGRGEEHVIVPLEKIQFEQGKCIKGGTLDPYCKCSPQSYCGFNKLILVTPMDAVEEYTDHYVPIWLDYLRQLRQTHCFDIDVHPGSSFGSGISPYNSSEDAELMMELANRAIQEYNERECNVFKYKVLKIEKVNFTMTCYFEYWMTVKVLNLTLGTPIETFQIHAGQKCRGGDEKIIYCCQPKEEAVVGLANCDLCFRKLRGESCPGGKKKALDV